MKITVLQILIAVGLTGLTVASPLDSNGQGVLDNTLSISAENEKLVRILSRIENLVHVKFSYNPKTIPLNQEVSMDLQDAKLKDVLGKLLQPLRIDYEVSGDYIILSKAPVIKASADLKDSLDEMRLDTYALSVSGTVTSSTGESMPGVNIIEKGTTNGTTTDVDGRYSLSFVDEDAVLVFSFIGYTSQEVPVNGRSVVDVILNEDVQNLEEVVVVGYGEQKKVNVTGALSTVSAEDLKDRPITNASQALQGLHGVYVNQPSSQPGADNATIRIRGVGTLNNNEPLVLVDGIEYSLRDVSPNDIASITVLKDAASAAIYGNRAANGVILITTKTGEAGKFQINYDNYFGRQHPTYLPDAVTNSVDYMMAMNQALANGGAPAKYTQAQIDEFKNGDDPVLYPNTDWIDLLFNPANMQEHNLRFSGGSEKTQFSISMGYLDQDGILLGTSANKYSVSANINAKVTDKLSIGGKFAGTFWQREESAIGSSGLLNLMYRSLPFQPNKLPDGRYADSWVKLPEALFRHPVGLASEGSQNFQTQRILMNLFGEYELPFNLTYKLNLAANKYDYLRERFVPEIFLHNPKDFDNPTRLDFLYLQRSALRADENNLNLTVFQTINWNKTFADSHNLSFLLGTSVESFKETGFSAYREGYFGNELTEIDAGSTNPDVSGSSSTVRLLSYFGRLNYDFQEKYLFEANFRYDGSSRFAEGNRWGIFPSFSAGWRLDQEEFLQSASFLDALKLRASWGKLGNQAIGLFRYANTVNIGLDYSFNNNIVPGAAVTQLSDPTISWETTTVTNIGLDATFFGTKVDITLDVFKKQTSGILRPINIPAHLGNLVGPTQNIGDVVNEGVEVSLLYRNAIGDFHYEVGGNLTYIENEVTNLDGQTIISGRYRTEEGRPIDSYYLLDAIGIFQTDGEVADHAFQSNTTSPGDIKYRDVDANGIIDNNDRVYFGGVIPKFTYSFNLGLDFKGIDLRAFLQGVDGVYSYTTNNLSWPLYNGAGLTHEWLTDTWTPENPNTGLPRLTTQKTSPENFRDSDFWLKESSYLRLKNIQVGYTLPESITDKVRMGKVRVFANGQNLLTFSNFKLVDPERSLKLASIYEYPSSKIYSLGVNVTF